jgi:acetolactate synthase-1/2/3 large subunit
MVRQFQEENFDHKFYSTVEDYSAPSFEKVAAAYGIKALTKKANEISEDFLMDFFSDDSPSVLDLIFDGFTMVEPKLLFGNTLINMYPSLPT